jgi:hypothetical protein
MLWKIQRLVELFNWTLNTLFNNNSIFFGLTIEVRREVVSPKTQQTSSNLRANTFLSKNVYEEVTDFNKSISIMYYNNFFDEQVRSFVAISLL